jgi:hypothetical protein
MTDISEADIESLATGIQSISTAKEQALGQYIMNQINAIVSPA